jgi:hypothetical protein
MQKSTTMSRKRIKYNAKKRKKKIPNPKSKNIQSKIYKFYQKNSQKKPNKSST